MPRSRRVSRRSQPPALAAWLAVGCLFAAVAAQAEVRWQRVGPWGGGVPDLAIDPRDAAHLVAAGGGGVFETRDAGASWRPISDALESAGVGRVAICDDGVWTSGLPPRRFADGRWSIFADGLPSAGDFAGRVDCAAGGAVFLGQGEALYRLDGARWTAVRSRVAAWAVDPRRPAQLWGIVDRRLLRSTDAGRSWRLVGRELPFVGPRLQLVVSGAASILDVLVDQTVWRSRDGGRTWTGGAPLPGFARSLAADAAGRVYAVATSGLWRSADGGRHWTKALAERTTLQDVAVARDGAVWVADIAETPTSLLRSRDHGARFVARTFGLQAGSIPAFAPDPSVASRSWAVLGARVMRRDGLDWTPAAPPGAGPLRGYVDGVSVDPWRQGVVCTTLFDNRGPGPLPWCSDDAGATWIPAVDATGASWGGLPFFDPARRGRVFAIAADGLRRSTDAGVSWTLVLPETADLRAVTEVTATAADPDRIWAAGYAWDGGRHSPFYARLFVSTDGGDHWNEVHDRLPGGADLRPLRLALDPLRAGRAWVAAPDAGGTWTVLRSDDGGATWQALGTTPPIVTLFASRRDASPAGTLLASVLVGDDRYELRASHDGGATWEAVAAQPPLLYAAGLAEDAAGRLWAWGRPGVAATAELP